MEVILSLAVYFLFAHFVADFVFQTDWMALNKSSSLMALNVHILVYSLILFAFTLPLFYYLGLPQALTAALTYVMINATSHSITDYFTSRLTTKLWKEGKRHQFFVVIGLDQFLHAAVLLIALCYV
jgi:hypothetical protein